ncbi:MAG: DUF1415 domain-containing protein [Ferruginibacter sp.]|nr:DUF1415 domain-containing protein [Bacteroidota bacterium]MBX2918566.1 DUF1415 domain-containing protein [Ferruginibacter sp.]MCB0708865.1 DUF1415 domain-containing protein [Chitinophagaceae bacterium]MCC7378682.1 DUF1415 domain-containing protein [Chitinophagaceae bacterium]
MPLTAKVIEQTQNWIRDVVIACNFCPFAANVVKKKTIFYRVENSISMQTCLKALAEEVKRLDNDESIETTLLILTNATKNFDDYLDLFATAEEILKQEGYEGIYQLASFHPLYCFAGAAVDDAANYTNRSPYPMLHILRESSIDAALLNYKNPEAIPQRNIDFARQKGLLYMQMLRDACF